MTQTIKEFRTGVTKHLPCSKQAKNRLLATFDRSMLAPVLEEFEQPSADSLQTALGAPETVAAVLAEQLTEEEIKLFQKQKKLRKGILIGVCIAVAVAILAFAIYTYHFKEYAITVVDHGVVEIGSYVVD